MIRRAALLLLLLSAAVLSFAQRTDLAGLKFCIDPGHGGYNSNDRHVVPDPGTDFLESESNFLARSIRIRCNSLPGDRPNCCTKAS